MGPRIVPVPFWDEELQRLDALAAEAGSSVAEYVRLCVFGPVRGDDAAATLARIEGARIRARRDPRPG